MIKSIEKQQTVLLLSKNAKRLAEFYKKMGLTLSYAGIVGKNNEQLYFFEMEKGSVLYIADATDKVKNSLVRNVLNFEVENIYSETRRLEDIGIKKVQEVHEIKNFGYVSTFVDIEGNYFQLIQEIPSQLRQEKKKIIN
jgi:predicted enzyme related to lactoylglutathione lyase